MYRVTHQLVTGDQVSMTFTRNKKIRFSNEHSCSLVVAYGATRLLATKRHKAKPGKDHAKIDNLFDPFLPITNPSEWLISLDRKRLEEVNEVLLRLMPKNHQVKVIIAADGSLSLNVGGIEGRQFHELSGGYLCMIGMAVDIMQVLSLSGAALDSAEGIVLIDELGNHSGQAAALSSDHHDLTGIYLERRAPVACHRAGCCPPTSDRYWGD